MEEDMADKPSKLRSQQEKLRPTAAAVRGIKDKEIELDEEDLKRISGGTEVEHKGVKY
jgi:hypothetical protein